LGTKDQKLPTLPLELSNEEKNRIKRLLASKVVGMFGRKLEEADWTEVYCKGRGIPNQGWSNLRLDVMIPGLGLEIKMLSVKDVPIVNQCGTSLMHPSATRSISLPSGNAHTAMKQVLTEYSELLETRRLSVEKQFGEKAELRSGWLLWKRNLDEFLYFEEKLEVPDFSQFTADWYEHNSDSARRRSRNLWIFDQYGRKRYSVTTERGVKVQPYFDIPPLGAKNMAIFKIQGEEIKDNLVRIWLTSSTFEKLLSLFNSNFSSKKFAEILGDIPALLAGEVLESLEADLREIQIEKEIYERLCEKISGVSDEHRIRQFISHVSKNL
jgi:hypothetical protein